ncbi:DUF819 family protein [bacterium]|nr:MAG: DUF819 family protein [bacterium]
MQEPLITNDAVVLGILMAILAFVFKTSSSENPFFKKFYTYVPSVLMCYFLPSVLNSLGIVSGEVSKLYRISADYLLPTSLVLFTLSIDLKRIIKLGPKALIMFFTGTVGIMLGGPLAVLFFSWIAPDVVGGVGHDAVWRGLATIAGSWIGGGANQTAMKEVYQVSDAVFSSMVTVDVIVANIWMGFLLYAAGRNHVFDKWLKADTSAIDDVQKSIEDYRSGIMKLPNLSDTMTVLAVGFSATAIAHFSADTIVPALKSFAASINWDVHTSTLISKFFWIVVIATTLGLGFSFTKARQLEGVGASRFGSLLLYILVASIGMKMDVTAIFDNPGLFLVGLTWMIFHAALMIIVAKLIKAPLFFMAVGSQANVGGAASAPIVASAFNPSLAPVGVLLAVLGYALGTYGALICAQLMSAVAP